MLKSLAVKGFKSLVDTGSIEFAPVTVLFGPNGGGKSNVLDALEAVAQVGAVDAHVQIQAFVQAARGRLVEQFTFAQGGLSALVERDQVSARMEATLLSRPRSAGTAGHSTPVPWAYSLEIRYRPRVGDLVLREVPDDSPHAIDEFGSWRSYYFDPRVAMRAEQSPLPVFRIGSQGENLISYLFQLKNGRPEAWAAVRRTLRAVVPSVEHLDVRLEEKAGTLELDIVQAGVAYSSRLVSDGTLRALGLIAAMTDPNAAVVGVEEPENGVHPQRIELIARMMVAVGIEAPQPKQVIVTTHSPILCGAMIRHAREHPGRIALLRVVQGRGGTRVKPLDVHRPAFQDEELRRQLATVDDVSVFEGLVLRGLLDD